MAGGKAYQILALRYEKQLKAGAADAKAANTNCLRPRRYIYGMLWTKH